LTDDDLPHHSHQHRGLPLNRSEFWATKARLAEYHAVVFEHPAFVGGPVRLVANQFQDMQLGGHLHTAAPMQITPPEQKSGDLSRMTIAFPRPVVGRQFKRRLQEIQDSGSRAPIVVRYGVYLGATDVPQMSWMLYASDKGGVNFGREFVQVVASDDNPMRLSAAEIYDPEVFTGLQLL